jgi:hypothetical protein
MAETVDLRRIAAQSCKQEALSRRECVSAFCLEICFTSWLTFRQANELSGHVRKGEESTMVVYWKVDNVTERDQDPLLTPHQRPEG